MTSVTRRTSQSPGARVVEDTADAMQKALLRLEATQTGDGSWRGDYGGPVFLLPALVAAAHIMEEPFDDETAQGFVEFFRHHQNADGGWPLYTGGASYVYSTTVCYVALRLLGLPPEDRDLARGRAWLMAQGGATYSAPWGKFLLALLGLCDYDAVIPVPPELWLLPRSLPTHPSRFWCHCRMVYLPMSFLYGIRAKAPMSPLIKTLRAEIYPQGYEDIDWRAAQTRCAETDRYTPLSRWFLAFNRVLNLYERVAHEGLRTRATNFVLDQVRQEDENTHHICIGPVSKVFNMLCWHFAEPGGERLKAHLHQLPEYLWSSDHGIHMQGYNSSQLWDTTLAVQAICATGRSQDAARMLKSAFGYIDRNQVRSDVPDRQRYFRDSSKGGWPFSDSKHGWPISDCTAEGLKTALALEPLVPNPIGEDRLLDAVGFILELQNRDGGWPSYERARAPYWLEVFNPSMVFAGIMVDYSYVECTSACIQALAAYRSRVTDATLAARMDAAVGKGRKFLLSRQRDDGSWFGSWGVCFTYGTWFGITGLRAAGLKAHAPEIRRAAEFLVARQLPDGGWGETMESCRQRSYTSTPDGQTVMTAWALLGLAQSDLADSEAMRSGVRFLRNRQNPDGSWPPETIAGVFNRTCGIHYDNYRQIFGLWALAAAESRTGPVRARENPMPQDRRR